MIVPSPIRKHRLKFLMGVVVIVALFFWCLDAMRPLPAVRIRIGEPIPELRRDSTYQKWSFHAPSNDYALASIVEVDVQVVGERFDLTILNGDSAVVLKDIGGQSYPMILSTEGNFVQSAEVVPQNHKMNADEAFTETARIIELFKKAGYTPMNDNIGAFEKSRWQDNDRIKVKPNATLSEYKLYMLDPNKLISGIRLWVGEKNGVKAIIVITNTRLDFFSDKDDVVDVRELPKEKVYKITLMIGHSNRS